MENEEVDLTYELMLQLIRETQTNDSINRFSRNNVSSEEFQKLPNYSIIKNKDLSGLSDSTCSICLDNYKCRQHFLNLNCNHSFHKKCIIKWFKKYNRTCPVCRLNPFT